MESELWKFVPETDNYMVSNKGRIKKIPSGNILKPHLKVSKFSPNYKRYRLTIKSRGIKKTFSLHILIAQLFIENLNRYKHVIFKDDNYENITSENLEWVSKKDFLIRWRSKRDLIDYQYYGNEPKPIKAVCIDTGDKKYFDSISDAASFFDTRGSMIGRVITKKQNTHRGHYFFLIDPVDYEMMKYENRI